MANEYKLTTYADSAINICLNADRVPYFKVVKDRFSKHGKLNVIKNFKNDKIDFYHADLNIEDLILEDAFAVSSSLIIKKEIVGLFYYFSFTADLIQKKYNEKQENFSSIDIQGYEYLWGNSIKYLDGEYNWNVLKNIYFFEKENNIIMIVQNIFLNQTIYSFIGAEEFPNVCLYLEKTLASEDAIFKKTQTLKLLRSLENLDSKESTKNKIKI